MGTRQHSAGPASSSAPDAFVGRQPELDHILALLLRSQPLITLLGPGGIGKTRLAAEAVARFQRGTGAKAYWARLARLSAGSDGTAVIEEIAHSVLPTDFSGRSEWEAMTDALAGNGETTNRVVLIMDNCEHILAGAGGVADRLTATLPNLTIVATSREALGWVDEHRVLVPPLPREHSIALFRQHSALISQVPMTPDQHEMIAEVCRHVNYHPLYIRLAAARLIRVPLPAIVRELSGEVENDQRLRWSEGPRAGADERHRGVRDVISWSYDLLDDRERILLERMAVFAAGHDTHPADSTDGPGLDVGVEREAITFICSDPDGAGTPAAAGEEPSPALVRAAIPALLDRLADQSLVSTHITATTVRYSLLESIRIFAQHKLELRSKDGGERARLERRHSQYYRDKLVDAANNWFGPAELQYLDWARGAWDNILTAVDRSLAEPGQAGLALDICRGLLAIRLPFLGCSFREIRLWSARTLQATRSSTGEAAKNRVETTALVVWIALCQGMHTEAESMLDECVRMSLGESATAALWYESAETDLGLSGTVEFAWGASLLLARSDPRSITVLRRAAEKLLQEQNAGVWAMAGLFEALALGTLGSAGQTEIVSTRYLERVEAAGASWMHAWAQLARAVALTRADRVDEALQTERAALTHMTRIRDQWGGLWAVQFRIWTLARIVEQLRAAKSNRPKMIACATEIAQLAGGTQVLLARMNIDVSRLGPFSQKTGNALAIGRAALGESSYAAAEAQGRRLRPELGEVYALALGNLSASRPADDSPAAWHVLTPAEKDVAILAAAGWTNSTIAVRRGSSPRTVDAQIAAILHKLAIGSRTDIGAQAPRHLRERIHAEARRSPDRAQRRR